MRPSQVQINGAGQSAIIPLDRYGNPPGAFVQVTPAPVGGAVVYTYTVEATNDDIYAPGYNPATGNWFEFGMSSISSATFGNLYVIATAVRLNVAASDGILQLRAQCSGGIGSS